MEWVQWCISQILSRVVVVKKYTKEKANDSLDFLSFIFLKTNAQLSGLFAVKKKVQWCYNLVTLLPQLLVLIAAVLPVIGHFTLVSFFLLN